MRRLMVVDDEQALRNGLANYLQKIQSPFDEVITASTGREALDLVGRLWIMLISIWCQQR